MHVFFLTKMYVTEQSAVTMWHGMSENLEKWPADLYIKQRIIIIRTPCGAKTFSAVVTQIQSKTDSCPDCDAVFSSMWRLGRFAA